MKSESRIPLTRLEACTLMAREAVSLLEGGAEPRGVALELDGQALVLVCHAGRHPPNAALRSSAVPRTEPCRRSSGGTAQAWLMWMYRLVSMGLMRKASE